MATHRECDLCQRRITADNPIVAKLFFTPLRDGMRPNSNDYTLHADVGQCCTTKVHQWQWQKREVRGVTLKKRKLRAVNE